MPGYGPTAGAALAAHPDVDKAVANAVFGIYTNCGQVCTSGSRIFVHESCPFGGYKLSGYGRKNGVGMVNYLTRTKSVAVDLNDFTMDLFP